MGDNQANPPGKVESSTMRRAIAAAAMGNAMEWFDFGVYSYMAITIGDVFFPSSSSGTGTIKAFAAFAVAFLIRPFGGMFFGPLGDKIGRKKVLAATMIMMAAATFVIGLLPSYSSVGVLSPILLVLARLVQGFSTGGEYGGAATFIAEYAPDKRRGFFCSFLELGTLAGYSLGAGLVTLLQLTISENSMHSWGWRIPFLVAGPIGLIGLYLRSHLEDTPAFRRIAASGENTGSLVATLRRAWRPIMLCIGLVLVYNVVNYVVLSYLPTYLSDTLTIADTTALLMVVGVMVVMMAVINQVGRLSDHIGRNPILIAACVGIMVLSYPAFALMAQGSILLTLLGLALLGGLLVLMLGTMSATLPALFDTTMRYGAFAVGYNISTSLFGGTAPFVVSALIHVTGNDFVPAYYLMAAAVISLGPILAVTETARRPLPGTIPMLEAAVSREAPALVARPTFSEAE